MIDRICMCRAKCAQPQTFWLATVPSVGRRSLGMARISSALPRLLAALLAGLLFVATGQPQTYEQLVECGLRAAQADSLAEAESLFYKALRLQPSDYRNALLYTDLGRVQEALYWQDTHNGRKADEALESYGLAIGLAPEAVPMLMARAAFYLRLGIYDKAILDFTRILTVNEQHLAALNYRAYCHGQLRSYGEARQDYDRVLSLDEDNYEAQLGLAILEQQTGHLNAGIERMTQLIEEQAQTLVESAEESTSRAASGELYSVRAGMYAENQQPELALLDLDTAVQQEPENVNYILARAYLHQQQGNKRLALKDFEQAIALGIPPASLSEELKACK